MRRTLTILAIIGALVLAACGSGEPEEQDPIDEDVMAEATANAGIPPEPDQVTADAYVAALDAINPGIVHRHPDRPDDAADVETAIDRGRDQCSTIQANPDDRARQIETTNIRFTSPDAPDGWGPEIAEQILDVVRLHLCPT